MRVISSARSLPQPQNGWSSHELEELMRLYAAHAGRRKLTWATAVTECDDPQFFLIGPEPEAECLTAISRVGERYVLEDGAAHVLCESRDLAEVAKRAQLSLQSRSRPSLLVRLLRFGRALRVAAGEHRGHRNRHHGVRPPRPHHCASTSAALTTTTCAPYVSSSQSCSDPSS